ncbi:hypothetical protein CKO09_08770 [Chromatium weissei]|nr:hypothetical protein [Chromatium weissei]
MRKYPALMHVVSRSLFIALVLALALPAESWARSKGGGHSRSSSSSSHAVSAPRTPSTSSGGYRRAAASFGFENRAAPTSSTDQTLTRQTAKEALTAFRAASTAAVTAVTAAPARPSTALTPSTFSRRPSIADYGHGHKRGFFDRVDLDLDDVVEAVVPLLTSQQAPAVVVVNTPPAAVPAAPSPSSTSAAIAPISAPTSPLTTPSSTVTAPVSAAIPPTNNAAATTGWSAVGWTLLALMVIGGVTFLLWRRSRRRTNADSQPENSRMFGLSSRQPYRPKWFRIGMTLPVDPSLFILAAPYSAITAPEAATTSGLLSVEHIGTVESAGLVWYRLYVSGGQGFFQLHLNADGQPDECRYFSHWDEVAPADGEEWALWLDAHEGMIGWPTFATKEGQHYQRHWSPGTTRLAPRQLTETLETAGTAMSPRHEQTMLYARPTGAIAPAPVTEYLLISAVEQNEAAWIALWIGIDLPIAALQLS